MSHLDVQPKARAIPRLFTLLLMLFVTSLSSLGLANADFVQMQRIQLQKMAFTENRGQWADSILFRAYAGGPTMWFTKDGVYYQFARSAGDIAQSSSANKIKEMAKAEQLVFKANFVGANGNPVVLGERPMEYKCNFFLGNDKSRWQTDVPNFEAISYQNLYDGIDVKFEPSGNQVIGYFTLSPTADLSLIRIHFEGAKSISIAPSGELKVETAWGELSRQVPKAQQEQMGSRNELLSRYVVIDDQTIGLAMDGTYDRSGDLILSIPLTFSTFLGGSSDETASDIAVNGLGETIVVGQTKSADFPLAGALDATLSGYEGFVTKFTASGNGLIFSTYLGGTLSDIINAVSLTGSSQYTIFLTGLTASSDFPTVNPLDATLDGPDDAFVASLNSAGNSLTFSTFLGGSSEEEGVDIATACIAPCSIDRYTVWVVGNTNSTDFPTVNAYMTGAQGGTDVFLTNYTVGATGNFLTRSSYYGGSNHDNVKGVAIVGSLPAKPYICGYTNSTNFPVVSAIDNTHVGLTDGFVAGFNFAGNGALYPVFSTYFGGAVASSSDGVYSIIIRSSGDICIAGGSQSSGLGTAGAYDSTYNGGGDAFVAELSSTGTSLLWCTYLGGTTWDIADKLVEASGKLYVAGSTDSPDFPTVSPYDGTINGQDLFLSVLSSGGSSLSFSTFIGGSNLESTHGLYVDNTGCAYVCGQTLSTDYPMLNPYDPINLTKSDAFLTKICIPNYVCGDANGDLSLDISDAVYLVAYIFSGGPAPVPLLSGSANCDGTVDISDAVYLISFIFSGGPAPCAGC